MKKTKTCNECGRSDCFSLKGWACRNPRIKRATFAEWYESKTGISLDDAKKRGGTDLELLEEAWNHQP